MPYFFGLSFFIVRLSQISTCLENSNFIFTVFLAIHVFSCLSECRMLFWGDCLSFILTLCCIPSFFENPKLFIFTVLWAYHLHLCLSGCGMPYFFGRHLFTFNIFGNLSCPVMILNLCLTLKFVSIFQREFRLRSKPWYGGQTYLSN